ncbi:MAG: cupin domain-containing protein [Cocleimonas sp.]
MNTIRPKAVPTKQLENDRVIITEWRFSPGAETGWHKHGYDYIVVPGLDGKLLLETKSETKLEEKVAELKEGQSYFRSVGIEHNVVNANDYEFFFIEVELK